MAITDGYFPQEGNFRGTDRIVNIVDILAPSMSPAPLSANETLEVTNAAVKNLTALTYAGATGASISVETAPIRVWANGVDPTSTDGFLVNPGGSIELNSTAEITGFGAIATTATAATIQVSYWG
jgi:hypothetical protein